MTIIYLPYDEEDLIEVDMSMTQDENYDWIVEAEVLQNKVFENPDDPRALKRFVDMSGQFSHIMSPADDVCVPALPDRNGDDMGCMSKVKMIFKGPNAADHAQEAWNGILADLDEYIRAKKLFEDVNMTDVTEVYIVRDE